MQKYTRIRLSKIKLITWDTKLRREEKDGGIEQTEVGRGHPPLQAIIYIISRGLTRLTKIHGI